ncbi:CBS domain-containing protein [Aneurinibacillus soli]|uniref:Putative nucleotidyltransferase substrate binding domain protein n=2 Tax=Aneurinibacillus soli TaxID=1500254 RepID=A0A0U5BG42_9BACL|nr:CBS domain-containing protein [Aneurinibacillus soli]BAU29255.1 putative nucleotidyltransferase substrate binding domain protein [Aneurinibacillus soli]
MESEAAALAVSSLPVFEKYEVLNEGHDRVCREAVMRAEQWMVDTGEGSPPAPYCWFELGSGGRRERTLASDQDHGIVYGDLDDTQPDISREREYQVYFLKFGRRIAFELEAIGYSLCLGNVMASNPRWCHEIRSWKQTLAGWMEEGGLDSIRYLLIASDMRGVYGDRSMVHLLGNWLRRKLYERRDLRKRFAEHSAAHTIPLGMFGQLYYERWGDYAGLYDMKEGGYYQIVNTVRILSLTHQIEEVGTKERLISLYQAGVLSAQDQDTWLHILRLFLHVRLTHHLALRQQGVPLHNYIDLKHWHREQKREWKEALGFLKVQQKRLVRTHT